MRPAMSKNGHSVEPVAPAHNAERRRNSRMSATRERVRSNEPTQSALSSLAARVTVAGPQALPAPENAPP